MSAMQMVVVNQPLPNGWFQATTEDGKPYYVNAFTQQTQWEFPQTPSTIHVLQSVHVSSSKKNGGVQCFKQVLCNKEHLIWIFVLILTVYDFITDIQVSLSWFTISDGACPQFHCNPLWSSFLTTIGKILLIISSIGFLFALIMKIYEAKRLYINYKYAIDESAKLEQELVAAHRALRIGCIPLIVEDVPSVILVFLSYFTGSKNILDGFFSDQKYFSNRRYRVIAKCFWTLCTIYCT